MILCCVLAALISYSQGIQFEKDLSWRDVLAKAKSQNKYIFIDAYATWCGPCKAMAAETFPQPAVGDVINANFIAVKVQMDKTNADDEFVKTWSADAATIAKESNITAYPTLLFYSPEGKLVHKTIGYKDASALILEAKNALDPSKQFFTQTEQYNRGELDTAQIKALASQAMQMGEKQLAIKVAQGYIKTIAKKDIYKKDNLVFIGQFLAGSKDPNFMLFLKNAGKVDGVVGKNYAENLVMGIIAKEEIAPYEQQKNPDWDMIEKTVIKKYGPLGAERVAGHRMLYYLNLKDWDNFGKYYKKYFDLAVPHERSFLHINNMSWPVFEHVTDKEVLATAVKTMKYDIEKFDGNDPAAIDTYANLLYKTGNKEEAIKWEEKALQLSNKKEFVDVLQKMKAGEKTW